MVSPVLQRLRPGSNARKAHALGALRSSGAVAPELKWISSSSKGNKKRLAGKASVGEAAPASRNAAAPGTVSTDEVTFADISRAHIAIREGVVRTDLVKSFFLSELLGCHIYLKKEFQQFTGSFKERGARNALHQFIKQQGQEGSQDDGSRRSGVVAASAGNHALALAWHGSQLDVPVTVVMPSVAPLAKVEKCRKFGANVIINGGHIGESKVEAERIMRDKNMQYINGYDDHAIIAGAGTLGIEIMDQCPSVEAVLVPVGGAGLIAGVGTALKTLNPDVEVIAVEPEFAASYSAAVKAGRPCAIDVTPTLADGLAVPMVGARAFHVASQVVDSCVTVSEKSIALAVLRLVENEKMVVEGGGAAGLAALIGQTNELRDRLAGKHVVVPLCGGNIDTTVLGRVLERGLAADHRLVRFVATVSDRPGGVAKLVTLLAELGVSIKDIYHERAWLHTSVDKVQIKCVVETSNSDHAEQLRKKLVDEGYPLVWGVKANEGNTEGKVQV